MRVLLTGSAGFLGRHFRAALEARGDDVVGVDTREEPGPGRWCADFRDYLRSGVADDAFDLVVHCAAVVGGRAKIDGDPLALAVNLELDAYVARWLAEWETRQSSAPHLVYISSSAVYPTVLQSGGRRYRLAEVQAGPDAFGRPDALYGWAKLTGEVLAGYLRRGGVPVTVVRPFSGYGEDQDLDYPFPSFVDRAVHRDSPFTVWGDGLQVRDWVHVDDVVGATLAAVDAGVEVMNVCSGRATTFRKLAALVCKRAGYEDPTFSYVLDAPRGVSYRVGDPARMLEVYGPPQVSLEEGVDRAVSALARRRLG